MAAKQCFASFISSLSHPSQSGLAQQFPLIHTKKWLPASYRASGNIGIARQRVPELCATVLPGRSLGLLAQNLQGLAADEGKLLAQFNQCLQVFPLRFLQKPFVVAVHQFLKTTVRFRRKTQISNSLYPVHRRGNG